MKNTNILELVEFPENIKVQQDKDCDYKIQYQNAEEAENAVKFSRYAPLGERGVGPGFATQLGLSLDDILNNSNNETLLILQMESEKAFKNLDDILEVEGYDVLLVGPADLSLSLGIPGDIHNPKIEEIMRKVVDEYDIMKPKHFVRSWKEYEKMKKFLKYETSE